MLQIAGESRQTSSVPDDEFAMSPKGAALLIVPLVLLGGCASSGVFPTAHRTEVGLDGPHFEVVATNVEGEASAAYLFGVSAAFLTEMQTVALFRIEGSGRLYAEAIADLWSNFEAQNGPATGRSLALVNVRYDSEATNLIVYTRPRIIVRADVVEFQE